jgi:hypothetical protein
LFKDMSRDNKAGWDGEALRRHSRKTGSLSSCQMDIFARFFIEPEHSIVIHR